MSHFEVKIEKIFVKEHPNAYALQLGNIGSPEGFQVVIQKDKYKTGDLVAYIGENAVVPDWLLKQYGFWNEEKGIGLLAGSGGNRVKAIKLRGEFSLGIVIPVGYFDGTDVMGLSNYHYIDVTLSTMVRWEVKEGEDVSDILGVTKYEPPIPTCMAGEVCNIIGHTMKYDIENWRKYPDTFQDGDMVNITEKLHGCVHPHSLIMLPNGEERSIGEIIENQNYTHVLSYDVETKKFVTKQISGRMRRPNTEQKKWVKLSFENGRTLILTEDHPLFSEDRMCYVEAKNILPNENIMDTK